MICPNCDFESPPGMRFCGMCGASLTITCPQCEFVNPVNYRFCGNCGTALLVDAVPARPLAAYRAPVQPVQTSVARAAPPASEPQPSSLVLTGERRVASVIFADVKGSTELLEQIGTESWVEVMNNLFQVLESQVYRYRGEVHQFRGDGMVALFGAKSATEEDPENAVRAALAMQAAIQPYTAELTRRWAVEVVMRVGVNTGEVIVGNVGDSQYSEDTAMGEALTVASRMETAAEPGTVLVSEATYRLTRSAFEWLPLGEIVVKGISKPISVFRPLSALNIIEAGQSAQEQQTYGMSHGLIGRKKEFDALRSSVERLSQGRGGIVLVTGVKGMGKSFLVNQVRQHFYRQNALVAAAGAVTRQRDEVESGGVQLESVRWMSGRCRSYSSLRPYSMWLDLLQEWVASNPEGTLDDPHDLLRSQIESQADDVERDYPNLTAFLSTPSSGGSSERARHMDAEGQKRLFFQLVYNWLGDLLQNGSVVISFADVQWADSTSLELLDFCLPLCDTLPILWILVYRPERDSAIWQFQHRVEMNYPHRLVNLVIPPLSSEENEQFIDEFIGEQVLLPETRRLLLKKSEGNPYFMKELIFSLITQGVLERSETGAYHQTRAITSLDLPDSLQSLLMARIDRLTPGERRILQVAAVIGSTFWLNAIQALAGISVPVHQIQADLVALQRAGLIRERAYVEDLGMEYVFDSTLVREVSYESLLQPQRIAYHRQVAEYLEEIVFREGKRRYFNSLAHHYQLAGDVKKELFYTLQAAERAQNIYANAEALQYYSRALELLDKIETQQDNSSHQLYAIRTQKFEALNGRRAVHFLIGNVTAGWNDARALLPLARQMDQDSTWLVDALLQQPGVASVDSREELLAGIPLAQEALDLSQAIGDKRREMNALLAITSQRNLLNDPAWVEVGDRALALAREIGDRQYEAMILLGLGHQYVGRDELQKGMEYLNAALPICQELDDRVAEMALLQVLGSQYERAGDHYTRLVEYEQKRLNIARQIGDRFQEGNAMMFCGQIQALNLGDLEGGLALINEALGILQPVSGRIFCLLRKAQVHVALGQFEDAQITLDEAAPVAERNVFELGRVGHKMVTVLLYNALGDTLHLRRSLAITDEILQMEAQQLVSRQYRIAAACEATGAHLALARLATSEGERQAHNREALASAAAALEVYEDFGYINVIECALEEVYLRTSQAYAATADPESAGLYLEKAYEEMMRKYEMIPVSSPFRRTYLENIAHHREIRAAHTAAALAKMSPARK